MGYQAKGSLLMKGNHYLAPLLLEKLPNPNLARAFMESQPIPGLKFLRTTCEIPLVNNMFPPKGKKVIFRQHLQSSPSKMPPGGLASLLINSRRHLPSGGLTLLVPSGLSQCLLRPVTARGAPHRGSHSFPGLHWVFLPSHADSFDHGALALTKRVSPYPVECGGSSAALLGVLKNSLRPHPSPDASHRCEVAAATSSSCLS